MKMNLNPLNKKVLITTDEVIFHGPTDMKVDPRILMQSIIVAELRIIKPVLGATIYNELIEAKNKTVTSDNISAYQTEINEGRAGREQITLKIGNIVNSATFLNDQQKELWTEHLHKLTAEAVVSASLHHNRARFTAQGVTKNYADIAGGGNTTSVSLLELRNLIDHVSYSRISVLVDEMLLYMSAVGYPGYEQSTYIPMKKNPINLSMYEDETRGGCRWY